MDINTIKTTKNIALIFFAITGILHLGSTIFINNNFFLKEAFIMNKTMDVPFIITGLIYGFTSLRLSLTDSSKPHKTLDIVLISLIGIFLIGLILLKLLVPNL